MYITLNILRQVCSTFRFQRVCKDVRTNVYILVLLICGFCSNINAQQQNSAKTIQIADTVYKQRFDTIIKKRVDTVFTQHVDTVYNTRLDSTAVQTHDYDTAKNEILALKNNLLYDAILTPNLEIEFRMHKHWSLELGAAVNPFPLKDEKFPKWRHFSMWVAPRYWFCNVFNRGFLSANVAYAHYNVAGNAWPVSWMYPSVKENRYQGDALMFGVSGGWHFAISPHFSIELEAGVDAGHTWFSRYECKHCGERIDEHGKGWFALPKVGISLVVPLGGDKLSLKKRCDCEDEDEPLTVIDTVLVVSRDTLIPAPVSDTLVRVIRDTVITYTEVPVPVDTVPAEPAMDTHSEEMQKLRAGVFRDDSEYTPYDINTALSADPRNVFLHFETNVTFLDRSFFENAKMLDSIAYLIGDAIDDPTLEITHIQIVGFASFDGKLAYNERLAGSRAKSIKDYLQERYPELDDSYFAVCNGGESWAELKYHFSQDDHEGMDEVVRLIDTEPDLDKREALIRKVKGGATYYNYIRKEYRPILRNLGCIMVYVKPK